jgi:hypothetical protein
MRIYGMTLYSLPSGASSPNALVRKAVPANGIPYSTPSKKAAVASFPANTKRSQVLIQPRQPSRQRFHLSRACPPMAIFSTCLLNSLRMPNLTASRTLSTVILGWYAGLVPCWKTPMRTRIEYRVFCASVLNSRFQLVGDSS